MYKKPSFIKDPDKWTALEPCLRVHEAVTLYGDDIEKFYTKHVGDILEIIMGCLPTFDWTSVNQEFDKQKLLIEQGGYQAATNPETFLNLLLGNVQKPKELGLQYGINRLIDEVSDPSIAVEIYSACDGLFFDSTHVEVNNPKKLVKLVKLIQKKVNDDKGLISEILIHYLDDKTKSKLNLIQE